MKKLLWLLVLFPVMGYCGVMDELQSLRWEVQAQIKFDPNSTDTLLLDDSLLNRMVNRALIKVAFDAHAIKKETTFVSVADQSYYTIDTNIVYVDYVCKIDGYIMRPLQKWNPPLLLAKVEDSMTIDRDSYTSLLYWQYTDSVRLWPVPRRVDTFLIGYSVLPEYLTLDTANTDLPQQYREAAVWYGAHLALWRMGRYDESAGALGRYNEEITKYRTMDAIRYDMAPQ